jgi:hypothetical protein
MGFEVPRSTVPAFRFSEQVLGPSVTDPGALSGTPSSVAPTQAAPPSTMSIWKSANNPTSQPGSTAINVWQAARQARQAGSSDEMVQLLSAVEREAVKSGISKADVDKAVAKGYVPGAGGMLHLISRIASRNRGKVSSDIARLAQSMGLNLGQDSLKPGAKSTKAQHPPPPSQASARGADAVSYGHLLRREWASKSSVASPSSSAVPASSQSPAASSSPGNKIASAEPQPSSAWSSPPASLSIDTSPAWDKDVNSRVEQIASGNSVMMAAYCLLPR